MKRTDINIDQLVRSEGRYYVPVEVSNYRGLQIRHLVLLDDYLAMDDPEIGGYQACYHGTSPYLASTKLDAVNGWMVQQLQLLQQLDILKSVGPIPFYVIAKKLDPVSTQELLKKNGYKP